MTIVFYSSSLFGATTLAAALDAGQFRPRTGRRLLVVSNNATVPEIARPMDGTRAFDTVRGHFDDIVHWNEIIAPMHPAHWSPRPVDVPLLSRLVCHRLGIADVDDVSELVVESPAVAPARTIAGLIRDCPITVYSDGLMSYGPTRNPIPPDIAGRVTRLLYLDLLPALQPLLLREHGVPAVPVPQAAFTGIVDRFPTPTDADAAAGCPVIIGQYLGALGIVSPAEEAALHGQMLAALVARGYRRIVAKPHPVTGRTQLRQLRAAAERAGVELIVADGTVPAEVWLRHTRPELVVSCFSTALLTASTHLGLAVATMGCDLVLERLRPYQNSNRIPATIVASTVPGLAADGSLRHPPSVDVDLLVRAVGYCMQPKRNPGLRVDAAGYVAEFGAGRYVKRRRLEALGLVATPLRRSALVRRLRRAPRRLAAVGHAAVRGRSGTR